MYCTMFQVSDYITGSLHSKLWSWWGRGVCVYILQIILYIIVVWTSNISMTHVEWYEFTIRKGLNFTSSLQSSFVESKRNSSKYRVATSNYKWIYTLLTRITSISWCNWPLDWQSSILGRQCQSLSTLKWCLHNTGIYLESPYLQHTPLGWR